MGKIWKKWVSLCLTLSMLLGVLPTRAFAAEEYTIYLGGQAMTADAEGKVSYYTNGNDENSGGGVAFLRTSQTIIMPSCGTIRTRKN